MGDGTENSKPLEELDTKKLLVKLIGEVHTLNQKFDSAVEFGGKLLKAQEEILQRTTKQKHTDESFKFEPDMMTLFSLPSALRKTVMALYKLGEATAEDSQDSRNRLSQDVSWLTRNHPSWPVAVTKVLQIGVARFRRRAPNERKLTQARSRR